MSSQAQQQEEMSPFPGRIIHFGSFNVTSQVHTFIESTHTHHQFTLVAESAR